MAVAVASRFSVLHLEDDDSDDNSTSRKTTASNNNKKGKTPVPAIQAKAKPKKRRNPNNDTAELQNLIFGTGKAKGKANNQNNSPKGIVKESQWEEWKEKDSKFVSESYEQDLQEALIQSKVDYEERKKVYDMLKAQQRHYQQQANIGGGGGEEEPKKGKKKSSSSKRDKVQSGGTTMSLGQFNNLLPSQIDAGVHNLATNGTVNLENDNKLLSYATTVLPEPCIVETALDYEKERGSVPPSEPDFFNQIDEDADKIIKSEQRKETFKKNQPFVAEQALSLELRDELEKKDKIIEDLSEANTKLKEDLKSVKYRNKKLCNILAQGEMRDKAEILIQVEQLINVRDELTEEVQSLHAALEQEKSKVHSLQSELKKQQSGRKETRKEST